MRPAALLLLIAGCVNTDVVGHLGGAGGSGGTTTGPDGVPATMCGGRVAEKTFRYGLCVCGQAQIGDLKTDVIDTVTGATSNAGAAVGFNNSFNGTGFSNVGSLLVSGNLTLSNQYTVNGDLKVSGTFGAGGGNQVMRDAWIGGDVNLPSNGLSVGRDLYAPMQSVPFGVSISGRMHNSPVRVDLPCNCNGIDTVGLVHAAAQTNDNASIGLDAANLPSDLTLPAGRFYLDHISGPGPITLHVLERTILFIGGDVEGAALSIDFGTAGELDLFVGGNLLSVAEATDQRPLAIRLYVAGAQEISLPTRGGMGGPVNDFDGFLYAPAARVTGMHQQSFVNGALFVGAITANNLTVHYDPAVANAAAACETSTGAGASCSRCQDCTGGTACMGGNCGACQSDSDCCAPLVCSAAGRCEPLHP